MSRAGPKDSRKINSDQQFGLQRSPASVSKVSHMILFYRS